VELQADANIPEEHTASIFTLMITKVLEELTTFIFRVKMEVVCLQPRRPTSTIIQSQNFRKLGRVETKLGSL
jgi:hypothetical protein